MKKNKFTCKQKREDKIKTLCTAIVKEIVDKGYADLFDENYNLDYTVNIGLTIKELRFAAELHGFKPSKEDLLESQKKREWEEYIAELDGVE